MFLPCSVANALISTTMWTDIPIYSRFSPSSDQQRHHVPRGQPDADAALLQLRQGDVQDPGGRSARPWDAIQGGTCKLLIIICYCY